MEHINSEAAARHLISARQANKPGGRLPEFCRPATVDDALAIQQAVTHLLGAKIGGWKCSLPSPEKPAVVAPIFAADITGAAICDVPADNGMARIEPEIAFVLGRDLHPRATPYSEEESREAIAGTHLVLELIGNRVADTSALSFEEKLADSLSNHGLYLGPSVAGALQKPLTEIPITVENPHAAVIAKNGRHPDGDPLLPLHWLINFLSARGESLMAGQVITTGSYAGVLDVPLDTELKVRFGSLGTLQVQFNAL